jgi:hypothetical protein
LKIQSLNAKNQFVDSWWFNTLVHDDVNTVDKIGNYFSNYQMFLDLKSGQFDSTYIYPITDPA